MKVTDYSFEGRRFNFKIASLPLPFILLVVLVILSFMQGRGIPGQIIMERQDVTKYGIIEGVLLVGAFYFMVIKAFIKGESIIEKEYRTAFGLMIAWILISIASAFVGITFGNNFNYLLGDFYKFLRFGLLFFLIYFLARSIWDVYSFYLILIVIWIAFTCIEIIQFRHEIMSGTRLTSYSVLASGTFFGLSLCFTKFNLAKGLKILAWVAIMLSFIATIISQTRGLLIYLLLSATIFFLLVRRYKFIRRKKDYLTPLLYLSLILFFSLMIFMLRDFLRTPFSGLHHRFTQSIPGETELVSIGGSRLHEALAVFSKFFADPGRIFLGFGMGSEIDTPFASGHFIHIGLVEIFFRTGAIGLIVFLWICVYFLKYAIRRVRVNIHFLLPIMVGTMNLITMFLLSSNPLLSPLYIVPIFAGMLKISTRSA